MQVGTIRPDLDLAELTLELGKNLLPAEQIHYVCLVNDREFKYVGITDQRLIFLHQDTLALLRFMPYQHMTKLKFNLGMWHIESKAQPLAYFGFAHEDRKPVHELFLKLGLPIRH